MFTLTGIHGGAQTCQNRWGLTLLPYPPSSLTARVCRSGIGLWHLLQAGRRPCSSDPLSRASCPAAKPGRTHAQGVSLQSAGPGRLWRTVLSAQGQASRGHRSLFIPLEVRLTPGPPAQQARRARAVGEQAGASPLRFMQFRSLNNRTGRRATIGWFACERRLAAANESSRCAHAYRILPPAARPPVTCTGRVGCGGRGRGRRLGEVRLAGQEGVVRRGGAQATRLQLGAVGTRPGPCTARTCWDAQPAVPAARGGAGACLGRGGAAVLLW